MSVRNQIALRELYAMRKEEEEERKRQAEAAEAENIRPLREFEAVANAEAEARREAILSHPLGQAFSGERVNGRSLNDDACVQLFQQWVASTSTFKKAYADTLLTFIDRNDLVPTLENLTAAHNLLLEYSAYPSEVVLVAPVQTVRRTLTEPTPEKTREQLQHDFYNLVVVEDPATGKKYTEHALSLLPSKEELRLRRILENGSPALRAWREIKDLQAERDARMNEES
jgi:hypothetical protein